MAKLKIINTKKKNINTIKGNYNKIGENLVELAENDDMFALVLKQVYECLEARQKLLVRNKE